MKTLAHIAMMTIFEITGVTIYALGLFTNAVGRKLGYQPVHVATDMDGNVLRVRNLTTQYMKPKKGCEYALANRR